MKTDVVFYFNFVPVILAIFTHSVFSHSCPAVSGCTCRSTKFVCNSTVNSLSSIPYPLPENTTVVNVSNHNISRISHENFSGLSKLKFLFLFKNNLESIPDGTFANLTSLTNIHLMRNSLQSISESTFKGLTKLRFLQLAFNRIQFIHQNAFTDLHNLNTLRIESNRLQFLSEELFRNAAQLSVLTSFNNPWICDCNLLWYILYANTRNAAQSVTRCRSPPELIRVPFSSLPSHQNFSCNDGPTFAGTTGLSQTNYIEQLHYPERRFRSTTEKAHVIDLTLSTEQNVQTFESSTEISPTINYHEHLRYTEWKFTSTDGEPERMASTPSLEYNWLGVSIPLTIIVVATLVIVIVIGFVFAKRKRVIGTVPDYVPESPVLQHFSKKISDDGGDSSLYLTPFQVNMYHQVTKSVDDSFQEPDCPSFAQAQPHQKSCAISMESETVGFTNNTATYVNVKDVRSGKCRGAFGESSTILNPTELRITLPGSLSEKPSSLDGANTQVHYENCIFKKKK